MNRLSETVEELQRQHRPRGAEAVLAAARDDARQAQQRQRRALVAAMVAAVTVLAGLAVWAAGGGRTDVETVPLDTVPTAPAPTSTPTPTPTSTSPPTSTSADDISVHFTPADTADCAAIRQVLRTAEGPGVLRAALEAQLAGPSEADQAAGLVSWFSADTAGLLRGVRVDRGTAFIDFDRTLASTISNASTSCGSMQLLAQLDATARQFTSVGRAIYSLDGDVDAFYGWLQMVAPDLEPDWGGQVQWDFPDGTVSAPGFADYVATEQPSWAFDPREAAMALLDLARQDDDAAIDIAHGAIDDGRTVVHVTQTGFADDSVEGQQFRLVFEQDPSGLVRLVEGTVAQRCRPGRGQQDFRPQPCI